MLENSYFICIIQELLTPSVRNPTQTWEKVKWIYQLNTTEKASQN